MSQSNHNQFKIRPLDGETNLDDYKTIFTSRPNTLGEKKLFPLTKEEAKNFIIVSKNKTASLVDLKTGATQLGITILVAKEFKDKISKESFSAFVRSLRTKLKPYKGVYIKDNMLFITSKEDIKNLYDKQEKDAKDALEIKKKMESLGDISHKKDDNLDDISTDATNDFSILCREAFNKGASDIHILLKKDKEVEECEIQFRILGTIEKIKVISYKKGLSLCSAAYSTMADSSSRSHGTFNTQLRQDCRIPLDFGGGEHIALRYSGTPTGFGANIVLRLLILNTQKKQVSDINKMGLLPSQVKMLLSISRKPIGAMIIAGVTGSGKSTTMRILAEDSVERFPGKKTISIEQPIEFEMKGVVQVSVFAENEKDKHPAAACVKSAMRQDPDNILIGEVRDVETANLLASAVESGHSVMGTVHASSALEVIGRLTGQSMKLPLDTVASLSFISGLVYQKLIPVLCEHCKVPFSEKEEDHEDKDFFHRVVMIGDLEEESSTVFTRSENGCPHCNGRGISGREVCAEVVIPDLKMRSAWLKGDFLGAYQHWRSTKSLDDDNAQGKTALEISIIKMKQGRVCPKDIEDTFGDIHEDFIMEDGVRSSKEVL